MRQKARIVNKAGEPRKEIQVRIIDNNGQGESKYRFAFPECPAWIPCKDFTTPLRLLSLPDNFRVDYFDGRKLETAEIRPGETLQITVQE